MFRRMRYLQRRGSILWIRRPIPKRLWPIMQKREYLQSLHTGDQKTAERLASVELLRIARELADAERALTDPRLAARIAARITDDEDVLDDYLEEKLEADERARGEAFDEETDSPIPPGPNDRKMSDAERAATWALLRRNKNGDGASSDDNPLLSILFERYYKDRNLPPKTRLEWENARRRLSATLGGDVAIRSITKADVRRFKDSLVGSTSERTGKVITAATVRKLLGALGTVFWYAVRSGYVDVNPTQGVAQVLTKGKPEDRRLPFTLADVKAILEATEDERGEDFWMPRLALYTGARANELCGLLVRDAKTIDGVPCVVVEDSEVRTLKTASSTRRIPVHPELIRLGFLDFVERQRGAGQARLFPELTVERYGSASAQYSKRFGRLLRSIGITDRRRYCTRHATP